MLPKDSSSFLPPLLMCVMTLVTFIFEIQGNKNLCMLVVGGWCPPAHSFIPLKGSPYQECAHLHWSLPKKQKGSRDCFFLLFLSPLLCSPMATSRLFKVVLGVPAACLAVIGSLFHLQNHLRFSPNHCPSSLSF